MSLTREIKNFALDLGYHYVGITTAEPFAKAAEELESRQDAYRWVIDGRLKMLDCATPTDIWPSAKSIIVVAYDYAREGFPKELVGKLGRLYQSRSYIAPKNRIHGARRHLFKEFLESKGLEVMLTPKLTVPERMAAARAGVATFGRNNFAYTKDSGSFIVITAFVVDAELEYDEPTIEAPCPEGCRLCIDACPTGALEPFKLNPRKCIAYNCFMSQDDYAPSTSSHIPPEIREKMGSWIHGCDICQEVCPRNQRKLKANPPVNEFLARIAAEFDLRKILLLTDEYYEAVLRPVMYNYIREKKYFQRNAAIAMGNSGDLSYAPHLVQALEDPEPLVRGYSAWALGRLGGDEACAAIEKALKVETDESAREEMEAALAA
ncbi:MAG: epoxyqueuosine reductase [Dehalococcoidia bacterium]|nr:epoxyqueuosine reductase [Dehalococcoidia bacterium]